jgi:hypothetical protein
MAHVHYNHLTPDVFNDFVPQADIDLNIKKLIIIAVTVIVAITIIEKLKLIEEKKKMRK